jgi:hypothetical protein
VVWQHVTEWRVCCVPCTAHKTGRPRINILLLYITLPTVDKSCVCCLSQDREKLIGQVVSFSFVFYVKQPLEEPSFLEHLVRSAANTTNFPVCSAFSDRSRTTLTVAVIHTRTHTHTYIHTYIYIYIYITVCEFFIFLLP